MSGEYLLSETISWTQGGEATLEDSTDSKQRTPSTEQPPPPPLQNPPEEEDSEGDGDIEEVPLEGPPPLLQDAPGEVDSGEHGDFQEVSLEGDTSQYADICRLLSAVVRTLRQHGALRYRGVEFGKYRFGWKRKPGAATWFISLTCHVDLALEQEALAAEKSLHGTKIAGHHVKVAYSGPSGQCVNPVT